MKILTKIGLSGVALGVLAATSVAQAQPFYINIGSNYGGSGTKHDGGTTTGLFNEGNFEYWSTTTVTDANNNGIYDAGDTVVGTGGRDNVPLFGVGNTDSGENRITSFSPVATLEDPTGPSLNGYGSGNWELTFGWNDLAGVVNSVGGIDYNSGTINFYLSDSSSGLTKFPVMRILVDEGGNSAIGQSLNIQGTIDFTGIATGTALGSSTVGDLFNFADPDASFADLWGMDVELVTAAVDQNTEPFWFNGTLQDSNNPDFTGFYETAGGTGIISGEHDGSVVFQVPEPSALALIGGGVLALGLVGGLRRRSPDVAGTA